ncbi:hypothetical protein AB0I99_17390 [Streptomyces spongiicola]
MSVEGSPEKGGNGPDKKAFRRRLAELALGAALTAGLRKLFEWLFWQ